MPLHRVATAKLARHRDVVQLKCHWGGESGVDRCRIYAHGPAIAQPARLSSQNLVPTSSLVLDGTVCILFTLCGIMSGLEVAGVLLGTFPLIIAAIEHWRNCAKVGGYLWKARKEFSRCEKDVSFNEIIYKRNLKELLIPIVGEAADVDALVGDPGGQGWRDQALHEKLVARLQESYKVYLEIVEEMNETAEEIRKELCFDQASVQQKLAPPPDARKGCQPSPRRPPKTLISKSAVDYQIFRAKFCLGGKKREDLFAQLKECNQRLKKLLSTSDKMFALQNAPPSTTKQISALETAFKKAYQKSELLFRALQNSWNCTCQQYHFANLRLEHRNSVEVCFEIILMFIRPLEDYEKPWNWRALQCGGHTKGCLVMPRVSSHQTQPRPAPAKLGLPPPTPPPTPLVTKTRKVAFSTSNKIASTVEVENVVNPPFHLCKLLGGRPESSCLGIIGHGDGEYHLHPLNERKEPAEDGVLTLDFILSSEFEGSLYVGLGHLPQHSLGELH